MCKHWGTDEDCAMENPGPAPPTPAEICDGQFDEAAQGDNAIDFDEFQDLPASFGYTQGWTLENFEIAFNDHAGTDAELNSSEWQTVCILLQNASYKPEPTPPTP